MLHRFSKLLVHLGGTMTVHFAERSISLKKGDVLLVPPAVGYLEEPGRIPPSNLISMRTELGLYAHVSTWSENLRSPPLFQMTSESDRALHLAHLLDLLVQLDQEESDTQRALLHSFLSLLPSSIDAELSSTQALPVVIKAAKKYLDEHLSDPDLSVLGLAKQLGMDRSNFSRLFQRHLGESPQQYLIRSRIQSAQHYLVASHKNISEIAYEVGFSQVSQFSKLFKKYVGCSPIHYRNFESEGAGASFQAEA